jgi:hypothetical protein
VGDADGPREIGREDEGALEDGDEKEVAARIVRGDRGAELVDAGCNLAGREVRLAELRAGKSQ